MGVYETEVLSLSGKLRPGLVTTGIANFQLVSVVLLPPFVFFRCLLVSSLSTYCFYPKL